MNQLPDAWRPRYWVLDTDGRTPVGTQNLEAWALLQASQGEKHVGWDFDNEKSITVSTVFLGIDHNYGPEGPPILFETMIFGGPHNNYQRRYCTWDEAEQGHAQACELAGIKRKLQTWIEGEKSDERGS